MNWKPIPVFEALNDSVYKLRCTPVCWLFSSHCNFLLERTSSQRGSSLKCPNENCNFWGQKVCISHSICHKTSHSRSLVYIMAECYTIQNLLSMCFSRQYTTHINIYIYIYLYWCYYLHTAIDLRSNKFWKARKKQDYFHVRILFIAL